MDSLVIGNIELVMEESEERCPRTIPFFCSPYFALAADTPTTTEVPVLEHYSEPKAQPYVDLSACAGPQYQPQNGCYDCCVD